MNEIERLKKRLVREQNARKEAEKLLENKSLELWTLNQDLEAIVHSRTKELQRVLLAKDEFLSNMSHEIRTPLNAIMGFVKILNKSKYDKKNFTKYLNIIEYSGENLLQIINDILDLSKIRSGKFTIEKRDVELKKQISSAFELFTSTAIEKEIHYSLIFSDEFPLYANVDITRIVQVLSNLISNALKFTKEKGKVIVNASYNTNNMIISVEDNGIGMQKDTMKKVFNAFEQEDNSTSRQFGGTGLGLSISKSLIELMDGEISVESEKGKGSKFSFIIAIEKIENFKFFKEKINSTNCDFAGKLLVAEDNVTNQILIKIILDEIGVSFEMVENGVEAVEAVQNQKYSLVLMDNQMPIMSGVQATKEIRKLHINIPIVALSANVLHQDKENFQNAGMNDSLAKPIDTDELISILKKYMV